MFVAHYMEQGAESGSGQWPPKNGSKSVDIFLSDCSEDLDCFSITYDVTSAPRQMNRFFLMLLKSEEGLSIALKKFSVRIHFLNVY